jgi:hypothetical protein
MSSLRDYEKAHRTKPHRGLCDPISSIPGCAARPLGYVVKRLRRRHLRHIEHETAQHQNLRFTLLLTVEIQQAFCGQLYRLQLHFDDSTLGRFATLQFGLQLGDALLDLEQLFLAALN